MIGGVAKNVYVGKRNSAHRWRVPIMILLVAGMVALVALSHSWRNGLTLRKFVVEGNRILSEEEILQLAAIPKSIGLYELDLTAVETRIERHSFVKEAIVSRDLPSGVRIDVEERHPVAILAGSESVFLEADLTVLPIIQSRENFDLPVITGWRVQKSAGTKVESEDFPLHSTGLPIRREVGPSFRGLLRALDIIETAKQIDENLHHLISEVRILDGGDIVLYSSDFGVPIVVGHGGEARKLVYLREFWNQVVSREGAGKLQSVDLRFDGQILARWN